MDEAQLQALKEALDQSPDNLPLRLLVVAAHRECGRIAEAHALLERVPPGDLQKEPDRRTAAEVCLAAEDAERALEFAEGEAPETLALRARVLLALDRMEEGRAAYRRAVEQNATLEDPDLEARLQATLPETAPFPDAGRPRLRVIANDDTDGTEVQRLLAPPQETITFADVGGLDGIKKQISRKIILPFQKPSLFQRFRKKIGGGILLYGPPGCGKTLLARATAGECAAAFLNVSISDVLDMYIGESERKLHALFEQARRQAPAVLFFDELEGLGGKRQYSREATASKLVSQFLSELDGFAQNNHGVLILAATNVPWAIDAAFRRPGRFDRVLFVPPPDQRAREAILRIRLADRPRAGKIRHQDLARKAAGFSGADLGHLVETAVDEAIEDSLAREEEVPVTMEHLKRALGQVKPTTLEWLTTARNYARYANEAGQYDEVLDFLKRHGK